MDSRATKSPVRHMVRSFVPVRVMEKGVRGEKLSPPPSPFFLLRLDKLVKPGVTQRFQYDGKQGAGFVSHCYEINPVTWVWRGAGR